jgi:hypothetical protein
MADLLLQFDVDASVRSPLHLEKGHAWKRQFSV